MGKRGLVALVLVALAAALAVPGAAGAAKGGKSRSLQTAKGIGKLEPTALRRWPASFGGLWLQRGKIFVAFTARGKQRVARLGRGFAKPQKLHAVKVDDSLASLRALQAQMIAERGTNPVMVTDSLGRPVPLAYDLNIDIKRNFVVVITEQAATPELLALFRARYGEDVLVEQGPLAAPHVCNSRTDCPPFLRSGLRVEGSTGCSTAFGVLYPSAGERVDGILSAAHCGDPDANLGGDQFHNGVFYGEVVAEQQSGKVDAELHSVGNGFFSFFPLIYRSNSDQAAHVGKVGTYAGLLVGQKVCKAGITTGESCGPVLSKSFSPTYVTNGMDFIKADYCSDKGDSGAGVYFPYEKPSATGAKKLKRYEAQGVHSGGAKDTPCSSEEHFAVFGHIEFVQSALSVTVLKNPN